MPSVDSKTVSFRVSGAALERLSRESEALGITRSDRARQLVLAELGNEFEREILAGQRELLAELGRLREDVARTLVSVLDTVQADPKTGAKRFSTEEVQEMVHRYLRG